MLGHTIGARGCPMRLTSGGGVQLILYELEWCPALGDNPELSGVMGTGGT